MSDSLPVRALEKLVFGARPLLVAVFVVITAYMAWSATNLRVDAGFSKLLPLEHEYMKTFVKYRRDFGGANRILIAVMAREGDIFTPEFMDTLKRATDEVFFLPGVDRAKVQSIFTPNVRFTEVVEDGIAGGNVIPADFEPTPKGMEKVRENILKSGVLGRLVANDFSGAIISAQLLEFDPNTGEKLDYIGVAKQLEDKVRAKFQGDKVHVEIDVHIIGFAKVVGDISEGAARVLAFFGIAFLITGLLVYLYSQSWAFTLVPLGCSLIAVVWQLGLLPLFGFGLDPMSILVPFLVFAIGVSHGVQMISAIRAEVFDGADMNTACRASFRRLLVPGGIALASDTIGFITILLIKIDIIQEMAITASIGVAAIILTNLVLLPVLVSYLRVDEGYRGKLTARAERMAGYWARLARVAEPRNATVVILISLVLLGVGLWKGTNVAIGDLHPGVPELHSDSRYNLDSEVITEKFSIGVDVLSVIVETVSEGCIQYDVMDTMDRFIWTMQNTQGVQSVISLPVVAKVINAGWNEGSLKWRVLPRNQQVLVQAVSPVDTDTGLLNSDCSVMPVLIFTTDHKAETIDRIVQAVKKFREQYGSERIRFQLASSNVGVMAATNEAVRAAQFPMLLYVFAAIILLCLITFRSLRATLCIVLPLGLVSLLAYALMSSLEIGLKVNTLPVVALGVGIGVDYGIYIFSRFQGLLKEGHGLRQSYERTLGITGNGVVFTGITLAIGVATWIFSPLKFQADMGILLTFMFLVNMLGAILLLPALASWMYPGYRKAD
ncbi:MAG: RND family transporter [Chromatiales bacterium]|nr:RND family transporter [Chromatiales bacterium]